MRGVTVHDLAMALALSIVEVTRDPHLEDIELNAFWPPRVCFKCNGTTCNELIYTLAELLEELLHVPILLQNEHNGRVCLVAAETRL